MGTPQNFRYAGIGVGLLLVGAVLGMFTDPYLPASLSNAKKGYQAGFSAAERLVMASSFGTMISPSDVRSVSGTVAAVNGDKITVRTTPTDPFADASLTDRIIDISTGTKIFTVTQNTQSVIQGKLAAFTESTQANKGSGTQLPQPFTQTAASAADIAAGDKVTVSAAENIKTEGEFVANEILVEK